MRWISPSDLEHREALNDGAVCRPDLKVVTVRNRFGELEQIVVDRES